MPFKKSVGRATSSYLVLILVAQFVFSCLVCLSHPKRSRYVLWVNGLCCWSEVGGVFRQVASARPVAQVLDLAAIR
jgi:hypothetical protein